MTRNTMLFAIVAAAALAGCGKEDHTIVAGGPQDETETNATATKAPVELPPAIVATKTYRCADNAVVTVNYLQDGKSANVVADKGGAPVRVSADEAGKPMVAEGGYSVQGSPDSASATIAIPGHSSQSCKA